LVCSARRLILWVSRAENQGGQIVEPEAGEERSLRRVEKGELLNSRVELVDANLS
jgi:hypothetical protein